MGVFVLQMPNQRIVRTLMKETDVSSLLVLIAKLERGARTQETAVVT